MSAEQTNNFSFSDKTKEQITDHLKELEVGNNYILSIVSGDGVQSTIDVLVNRITEDVIALKTSIKEQVFPHGKIFIIIKFIEHISNSSINVEGFEISGIANNTPYSEEEDISASIGDEEITVEVQSSPTSSPKTESEQEQDLGTEDVTDMEFTFDVDDVVVEEGIEVMEEVVTQALSLWDRELTTEKRKALIAELLIEHYKDNKNFSIIDRDVNIYNELSTDKIFQDFNDHTIDYKPFYKKLMANKFNETNVYPIVEDKKIYYSNKKLDVEIPNILVLPNPVVSVMTDDDENLVGEISIRIQLIKDYYSNTGGLNGYKDYIKRIYEGGSTKVNIEDEDFDTDFGNLNLTHTLPKDEEINHEFYHIPSISQQTKLFRNCNPEEPCAVNPFKDISNPNNQVNIVPRMSIPMEYYLQDVYDDNMIVDSKGNRKKDVKTCNGTNKTGDSFYLQGDEDLKKSISKPPTKEVLYAGEALKLVGFFLESPYNRQSPVIAKGESTTEDNTKIYPKLFNNTLNLGHIGKKANNSYEIEVINSIEEFSYDDYDPSKNYFIYFNKDTTNEIKKLTSEQYNNLIKRIIPTTSQILDIESQNLDKCISIDAVNNVLSNYGLNFQNLDKAAINKLSISIIKNIKQAKENRVIDSINKLDSIELNKYFNKMYKTINNLKESVENNILSRTSIYTLDTLNDELMPQINLYFRSIGNIKIIKLFLVKFLNYSGKIESESLESLSQLIINEIIKREGKLTNRSIIDSVINTSSIIEPEILDLITRYLNVNDIGYKNSNQPFNKGFTNSDLTTFAIINKLKNTLFNGDEFKSILNLMNLHTIKQTITGKYTDEEINTEELRRLVDLHKQSIEVYNRERTIQHKILSLCNGVKVKKIYKTLHDVNSDNGKDIYADSDLSKINSIFSIIFGVLKGHSDLEGPRLTEVMKQTIAKTFMFLTESELDKYIKLFKDNVDGSVVTYEIGLSKLGSFKEPVLDNDYALLDGDSKYLFFRKGNNWISVDKDSYSQIQKCFMYDHESMNLTLDEIEQICSVSPSREEDSETNCIKIGDNHIPKPLFKSYTNIESINNKKNLIAKLLHYKKNIDQRIENETKLILDKIRITHSKNLQKYTTFNYKKEVTKKSLVQPSKKLRQKLNEILSIKDFDIRIERLHKFIEAEGILYSRKYTGEYSMENYEDSAKWVYYDSDKIDVPICCKHYLDYEPMLFKNNTIRENVLTSIKNKWCQGHTQGNVYVCSNCGESIDLLDYSEFEGFGKDNRIINVREKVDDEVYEDEDIGMNLDLRNSKVIEIINIISTKLGIILKQKDIDFILEFVSKNYIYNSAEFFREIYGDNMIFDIDFNSEKIYGSHGRNKIISNLGKVGTNEPEFKSKLESLLKELISNHMPVSEVHSVSKLINRDIIKEFLTNKEASDIQSGPAENKKNINRQYKILGNILPKLVEQVNNYYIAYITGESTSLTIGALSQVLVYASPSYTILSLGAERREKKSGFFIQKLTKDLSLEFLYNKLYLESTATRSAPSIRDLFNNLRLYLNTVISQYKFSNRLSSEYRARLEEITKIVDKTEYIEMLIINKELFSEDEELQIKKEYKWSTFLPTLNVNLDLTTDNLGLPSTSHQHSITASIRNFDANLDIATQIDSRLMTDELEQSEVDQLNKNKSDLLIENKMIINRLNGYYTKLGFLYMSIINRKIFEVENSPYNLSSYTASLGYDKLNTKYLDFFTNNYPDIKSDIENIQLKMNEISVFLNNIKSANVVFEINNVNNVGRNLQSYMEFNPDLYLDNDGNVDQTKVKKYLIKQLILINSLTILDNEELLHQKRHYTTLVDNDYEMYLEFIMSLDKSDKTSEQINNSFIEYYNTTKNVDISSDEIKKALLFRFNGNALYDIVSKRFKKDIEKEIKDKYSAFSNEELNLELRKLNVEFNKASLIDTTITYPMINNLISFKYKLDKASLRNKFELIGEDIIDTIYNIDKTKSFQNYIKDLVVARSLNNERLGIEPNTSKIEYIVQKIREHKLLKNNKDKLTLLLEIINPQNIFKNLNDNYYNELLDTVNKTITINLVKPELVEDEFTFKQNLLNINSKNNNLLAHINILSIVISYLNKIKNNHISPQVVEGSKLKIMLDNNEDNMLLVSESFGYTMKNNNLKEYSEQILSKSREDHTFRLFLTQLPDTDNIIKFISSLLSINNTINLDGTMGNNNILLPTFIKYFIIDIIADLLYNIFSTIDSEDSVISTIDDLLEEILFYIQINNKTELDIQDTIKLKKKKENNQRKNKFDRMTTDMQNIQKLMRRFNLGAQFAARNDDVEINEEQIYQEDMADHQGLTAAELAEQLENQEEFMSGIQAEEEAMFMGGTGFIDAEEMQNIFEEEME